MHTLRPLIAASILGASAFAQNGVIPPPPSLTPAAPADAAAPAAELGISAPNSLSADEKAQGWRLLFDGMKLIGMRGVQRSDPLSSGWKIQAGELNLPKEIRDMDRITGGDLITSEQYYDFDFRFEWRTSASSESGVRYLVTEQIGKSPEGLEYQIIDDVHNSRGLKGGGKMRSSSLEGVLPPGANAKLRTADPLERRGDPWNEGRILVQGNKVQHWMNGEMVLEFELGPTLRNAAAAEGLRVGPAWGGKKLTRIALLDQGTEVAYRNLKIRVLTPTPAVTARPGVPAATPSVARPPAPPVNPYLLPKRTTVPK